MSNAQRASRASQVLALYGSLAGSGDPAEAITDLVADLGHHCVENDLAYLHLVARGIGHWRIEMTDPESQTLPEVMITINESTDHAHHTL